MKYAGKTIFWRKGKLELPLPCANSYEQSQLQPKSLYCSQSWKNSITYAKYMWKMCVYALHMQSTCGKCVYVLLCATYVPSISQMHTVVLLQGKCKSFNVYRRAIYRRARRGEKLEKKIFSLATSPPKGSHIYIHTHYVCFSSFLFPGDLHDSLDILWQPLRKSDNLCGSPAIPSQVYEHK